MYNLLLEHDATGESIEAVLLAWFSFAHKRAAVKYSEYDKETGKVSLLDKMDGEEIGSESQGAIAEGLLDLTILNKKPEINRGAMTGRRYYDSDNGDMSRGFMTTEAWHGKTMGLKRGLQVRTASKRNNDTDAPKDGSIPMEDGDTDSDAEDTRNSKRSTPLGRASEHGRGVERIGIGQPLPSAQEDRVSHEHNRDAKGEGSRREWRQRGAPRRLKGGQFKGQHG